MHHHDEWDAGSRSLQGDARPSGHTLDEKADRKGVSLASIPVCQTAAPAVRLTSYSLAFLSQRWNRCPALTGLWLWASACVRGSPLTRCAWLESAGPSGCREACGASGERARCSRAPAHVLLADCIPSFRSLYVDILFAPFSDLFSFRCSQCLVSGGAISRGLPSTEQTYVCLGRKEKPPEKSGELRGLRDAPGRAEPARDSPSAAPGTCTAVTTSEDLNVTFPAGSSESRREVAHVRQAGRTHFGRVPVARREPSGALQTLLSAGLTWSPGRGHCFSPECLHRASDRGIRQVLEHSCFIGAFLRSFSLQDGFEGEFDSCVSNSLILTETPLTLLCNGYLTSEFLIC